MRTVFTATEYVPYLYLIPFSIKLAHSLSLESTTDVISTCTPDEETLVSMESTISSAMMMFNLALAHQTMDRTSHKAYLIYQLALTLLSALPPPIDSPSLLLHVAVLNNYGVWCYENLEYSSSVTCFVELMDMLDESCSDDDDIMLTLNSSIKRGIFCNVRAVLNV